MDALASSIRPAQTNTVAPPTRTVRVVKGLHMGALAPLHSGEMLVVGASEDCDLVLWDAGVARRHCILSSRDGGSLSVRAMGDAVSLNGRRLAPGQTLSVEVGTTVKLGEAVLALLSDANDVVRVPTESPLQRIGSLA